MQTFQKNLPVGDFSAVCTEGISGSITKFGIDGRNLFRLTPYTNVRLPQKSFLPLSFFFFIVKCHRGFASVPPRAFCKKLVQKLLFCLLTACL